MPQPVLHVIILHIYSCIGKLHTKVAYDLISRIQNFSKVMVWNVLRFKITFEKILCTANQVILQWLNPLLPEYMSCSISDILADVARHS